MSDWHSLLNDTDAYDGGIDDTRCGTCPVCGDDVFEAEARFDEDSGTWLEAADELADCPTCRARGPYLPYPED